MAMTNAQRQKAYRDRLRESGLSSVTLSVPSQAYHQTRSLGKKLRQAGPEYSPFPLPVTDGEIAVLLQVLRSIRNA